MTGPRTIGLLGAAALLAAGLAAHDAKADAVSDFYKGKAFTIYVGFAAGGGYDAYARLLGRHINRQIPGNPTVIIKNMTGSATIKLANWLYNAGPKDGTAMGMVARAVPVHKLLGGPGAKFDPEKFNWVGSMNNEVSTCVLSSRTGISDFTGLLNAKKTVVVGGQGRSSDPDQFSSFVKNLLGGKLRLVSGYPGTAMTVLALDRGEVDGICGWSWTSVKNMRGSDVKAGKLNVILQMALAKHPELPDIPLIIDFARTKEQMDQMRLVFSRQTMGRPFMLPPGVPKERVAAIRKAFMDTMNDPKFRADVNKSKLEINPVSGEEVQALVVKVLQTPKETVAAAKQNIFPKGPVEQAKLTYIDVTGTISAVKQDGRSLELKDASGKKIKARVSGSDTKITLGSKNVKRKALKTGLECTVSYLGPNTQARTINCK